MPAYGGENLDPLLAAGLRYLVAGHIWLPDGSDIPSDEIASQAGLRSLPYLDELPPAERERHPVSSLSQYYQ